MVDFTVSPTGRITRPEPTIRPTTAFERGVAEAVSRKTATVETDLSALERRVSSRLTTDFDAMFGGMGAK